MTDPNIGRYARQVSLPELGAVGQRRLASSRALVVGAGGLGTPAALYLAAAGVGTIGLVDGDRVEASNLHRQILYGPDDVGTYKTRAAARALRRQNPDVEVVQHREWLDATNAERLIGEYDVVLDGTDTFGSRYVVNDACVRTGTPDVLASVSRFEGQISVLAADGGPCYRCLFPEPPPAGLVPSCADGGVLGVVPGVLGVAQASEALKVLLGIGEPLVGRLWVLDLFGASSRTITFERDPACPACGDAPKREAPPEVRAVSAESVRRELERGAVTVLDVRTAAERGVRRIEPSVWIPVDELADRIGELDPAAAVAVVCESGVRSARAADLLARNGFENVADVRGGMRAWAAMADARA